MDQAPWVSPDQAKAAEIFRDFLLTPEQQGRLLGYGLRPNDDTIRLSRPISSEFGANPSVNLVTLDVPDVLVVDQIVEVWRDLKKPANVFLVFDGSGSMQGQKIGQAIIGAVQFVEEMDRKDWLAWLPFNDEYFVGTQGLKSGVGEQLQSSIRSTTARGGTALYDSIAYAYQTLQERRKSEGDTVRYGIVVLSDGKDGNSSTTLAMLEDMMRPKEGEVSGIQIHTIGVGEDADDQILTKIASISNGRYWKVTDPASTDAVYKRISKYW